MLHLRIVVLIIFIKIYFLHGTDENEFSVVSSTPSNTRDPLLNLFQNQLEHLEKNDQRIEAQIAKIIRTLENQQTFNELNEKFKLKEEVTKIYSLMENLVQSLSNKSENITLIQNKLDDSEQQIHKLTSLLERLEDINKNIAESLLRKDQKIKEIEDVLRQKLNGSTEKRTKNLPKNPKNCKEVLESGNSTSGVYLIKPESKEFNVYCEMNTRGGGWTVIHNRFDGSQNFDLNWTDYKNGFGNLSGEFWLGLEQIHYLTGSCDHELLIEMVNLDGRKTHAYYKHFGIGNELEGYELKWLHGYEGDAGDSLNFHRNKKFSTRNRDQDDCPAENCANTYGGGWWFGCCAFSNLNGRYLQGVQARNAGIYGKGLNWFTYTTDSASLVSARMMVRLR